MPVIINGLRVCVSNSSRKAKQIGSVRVKSESGEVLAVVQMERSDGLTWIRKNASSKEAQSLLQQLRSHDVPDETLQKLMKQQPSKYELSCLMRTA